jgi:hypothetical protein
MSEMRDAVLLGMQDETYRFVGRLKSARYKSIWMLDGLSHWVTMGMVGLDMVVRCRIVAPILLCILVWEAVRQDAQKQ